MTLLEGHEKRVKLLEEIEAKLADQDTVSEDDEEDGEEAKPEALTDAQREQYEAQRKKLIEIESTYLESPPSEEPDTSVIDAMDETSIKMFNYAIAQVWAEQFPPKWPLKFDHVCFGFAAGLKNETHSLSEEELKAIMYYVTNGVTYLKKLRQQIDIGKQFLQSNAEKEGVHVLPSGVQYKRLSPEMVNLSLIVFFFVSHFLFCFFFPDEKIAK